MVLLPQALIAVGAFFHEPTTAEEVEVSSYVESIFCTLHLCCGCVLALA